ncbi:MAG: ABC transporter ATP-binding protein [Prevotella sp.]|nr:ABC transporter ATP-binding protein [Staphylococcus sp.]MCM1350533.1 ABC transporter ATP-binding protein [Prevotella sp.]
MKTIDFEKVTKYYQKQLALEQISFSIDEHELFGLLGVNGAGKSTLIHLLIGLVPFESGKISIFGHSVAEAKHKGIINVAFQEQAIAKKLTVEENLMLMAQLYGDKTYQKSVEDVLEQMQLQKVRHQRAGTLSGGYQKRLSIAMAIVTHPQILILDEPTLGLDVLARHELWELIATFKGKMTILLTTHYLEEIEALCDRVAILNQGTLKAVGTIQEIKTKANAETLEAAFIALSTKEE